MRSCYPRPVRQQPIAAHSLSGHGFKFGSVLGRIVLDRLDGIQSNRWSPQFSYDFFLTASSRPRLL